jgi:hypothetical protein
MKKWFCDTRIAPTDSSHAAFYESLDTPRFSQYKLTRPKDPRRGRHMLRAAVERLAPDVHERVEEEDEALLEAEAQLPATVVWSDSDSNDEDKDFFPYDAEAGGSRAAPEETPKLVAAPTISEAQVTQLSELTGLLKQLVSQQSELATQQRADRLAAEEARRAHEARFT